MCVPHAKPVAGGVQVETSDFKRLNVPRFGHSFVDKVANARDILLFYRRRQAQTGLYRARLGWRHGMVSRTDACLASPGRPAGGADADAAANVMPAWPAARDADQVEDIILQTLQTQALAVLPANELVEAARTFVDKNENTAIQTCVACRCCRGPDMCTKKKRGRGRFITQTVDRTKQRVQATEVPVDDDAAFQQQVAEARRHREREFGAQERMPDDPEGGAGPAALPLPPARPRAVPRQLAVPVAPEAGPAAGGRGRGRGRGATAAAARGRGRGRTAAAAAARVEDDDDDGGGLDGGGASGNAMDEVVSCARAPTHACMYLTL
jgi:double-strand break repair protein MRE11